MAACLGPRGRGLVSMPRRLRAAWWWWACRRRDRRSRSASAKATRSLVGVGETEFLVSVHEGRIERVERGPFVMPSWRFALRGSAEAWHRFWQPIPQPGYHDLFALAKRGLITVEGDLHPLMANLI